ncbi:cytidine deaminase [Edaphobacter flagellatus]|uniref:cytidine deaminase n=1 Tax=Edaphobacter flagellatus TaxID=1933044 RepID=UPI0021B1EDCF|nr:cytidine deaminase [Edaphobacter flagellatus]
MSQNNTSGISSKQLEALQQKARAVAANAYAPYSHFRVGSALLLEDGNIVTGCNVENASYRLTTCAEQSAIAAAVALHGPALRVRAAVIANLNNASSQPCGACRQTLHEFSSATTEIFFPAQDGSLTRMTMHDLLPAAFRLNTDNA